MSEKEVLQELVDHVCILTLNRPERKNALNLPLVREFTKLLDEAEKNPEVRTVLIKGSNNTFSAGADLQELPFPPTFLLEINHMFNKLENLQKPTIAAIEGWCLAGGLELVICCDIRLAADNARIGDHHVKIGVIGGGGATTRLTKLIGSPKAKELVFTAKSLNGKQAEDFGLVNYAYPQAELHSKALAMAKEIATHPLGALRAAKVSLNASVNLSTYDSLQFSDWCMYNLMSLEKIVGWKDQKADS